MREIKADILAKAAEAKGYTEEEKAQIKEIFQKVADLNTILDKYDIETKFDWTEYLIACNQYFDTMGYR